MKNRRLTEDEINTINSKSYDQGIYIQPNHIPTHIKEPVIISRYRTGGYSGGNCWDNTEPTHYSTNDIPEFKVLDAVLEILKPNITYLQYKKIAALIDHNEYSEWEYYGNSSEYKAEFIILSKLYELLDSIPD